MYLISKKIDSWQIPGGVDAAGANPSMSRYCGRFLNNLDGQTIKAAAPGVCSKYIKPNWSHGFSNIVSLNQIVHFKDIYIIFQPPHSILV